jgi:hypothetical protein
VKQTLLAVSPTLGALLWLAAFHEDARGQEGGKAIARWEYCTLSWSDQVVVFFTSKQEVRSKSWKDLAKELKAPLQRGWEENDWVSRMAVFDFLGAQGWEVVSYSSKAKRGAGTERIIEYEFEALFKRRP